MEKMDDDYAPCPLHSGISGEDYRRLVYDRAFDEAACRALALDIDARWHVKSGQSLQSKRADIPDLNVNRTNLDSSAGCMPEFPLRNMRKSQVIGAERLEGYEIMRRIIDDEPQAELHFHKAVLRSKLLDNRSQTADACRFMLSPRCANTEVGHAVDQAYSDACSVLNYKLHSAIGLSQYHKSADARCEYFGVSRGDEPYRPDHGGGFEFADISSYDLTSPGLVLRTLPALRRHVFKRASVFMKAHENCSVERRLAVLDKLTTAVRQDELHALIAMPDGHAYRKPSRDDESCSDKDEGAEVTGSTSNGRNNTDNHLMRYFDAVALSIDAYRLKISRGEFVCPATGVLVSDWDSHCSSLGFEPTARGLFESKQMLPLFGGDDTKVRFHNAALRAYFGYEPLTGSLAAYGMKVKRGSYGFSPSLDGAPFYAVVVKTIYYADGSFVNVFARPASDNISRLIEPGRRRANDVHSIAALKACLIGHMANGFANWTTRTFCRSLFDEQPVWIIPDWKELIDKAPWLSDFDTRGLITMPTDARFAELYGDARLATSGVHDFSLTSDAPIPPFPRCEAVAGPSTFSWHSGHPALHADTGPQFLSASRAMLEVFRCTVRFLSQLNGEVKDHMRQYDSIMNAYLANSRYRGNMSQYQVWQQKKRSAPFVTPVASAGNAGMKVLEALSALGYDSLAPGSFASIGAHPGSSAEAILNAPDNASCRFVICSGPKHIDDSDREYCYKITPYNRSRCLFLPENFGSKHLSTLPPGSHITVDVSSFNDNDTPDMHWNYIKPIIDQVVSIAKQCGHTFDFKLRGCSPAIVRVLSVLNSSWRLDVFKPVYSYWWNPEVVVVCHGPRPTHLKASQRLFAGQLHAFLDQLAPLMAVSEVTRLLSRSPRDRHPAQLSRDCQEEFLRSVTDSPRFVARVRGDASLTALESEPSAPFDDFFLPSEMSD